MLLFNARTLLEVYTASLSSRIQGKACQCTAKIFDGEPGLTVFVREVAPRPEPRAILAEATEPVNGVYEVKWDLAPRQSATVNIECRGIPVACFQVVFFLGDKRIQSAPECKVIDTWNVVVK